MKRVIRLLDEPVELTARQLAQKRYQQSAKGKAALERYRAKVRLDPAYRAAECARVKRYDSLNRPMRRVYKRTWQRARKAELLSGRKKMNEQSWINDRMDRSKWPAGPWDGEPDKVQWKDDATGLDCLANRATHSGHWCGYVGVPPGHPLHGKDYNDVRFPDTEEEYPDVHGGLTYADACGHSDDPSRGICHIPAPGEPDGLWWFGFDCAHSGDWSPEDAVRERDRPEACWKNSWDASYRTLAYVKNNCAKLAAQITARIP